MFGICYPTTGSDGKQPLCIIFLVVSYDPQGEVCPKRPPRLMLSITITIWPVLRSMDWFYSLYNFYIHHLIFEGSSAVFQVESERKCELSLADFFHILCSAA
jgi:hypothetical protein